MYCFKVSAILNLTCRHKSVTLYRSLTSKSLSYYFVKSKPRFEVTNRTSLLVRCLHDFEVNNQVQNKYRRIDSVGNNYSIIYRAPLNNYVASAHYIAFFAGISLPVFTLTYLASNGVFVFPVYLGNKPLIRGYFDLAGFYCGFIFMVSQMYTIVRRYPMRVYSDNAGSYIAVYRGLIPWTQYNFSFKAGEVAKAKSFMPWGESLYSIKTKKAIFLEEHFLRPIDLQTMMGNTKENAKK